MIRVLLTIIFITVFPAIVGSMYLTLAEGGRVRRLAFSWIYGQMTLWAAFLLLGIPMILMEKNYAQVRTAYAVLSGVLCLIGAVVTALRLTRKKGEGKAERGAALSKAAKLLWIAFAVLFLVQIVCALFLAYNDGDDSYYVAITTYCQGEKPLYRTIPYTGYSTELSVRHALAPFPVWVALLAEISGLGGAAASHLIMPVFVLSLAYALFYLIGTKLFGAKENAKDWQVPLFLCFAALLVLFGGYSLYSPENFLLVRAQQGKAVFASVVIPSLIYLLMLLLERMERGEKQSKLIWLLVVFAMTSGCLCTSLGGFMLCVLLGLTTLCAAILYRKWKVLIGAFFGVLIPVAVAVLYVGWP